MSNNFPLARRRLLVAAALSPLLAGNRVLAGHHGKPSAPAMLAGLEKAAKGRLGVYALDSATGEQVSYRADERFAFCSTFKVMLCSKVLALSAQDAELLNRRIHYTKEALVRYSPVTEKHVDEGMTVAELCAAALQYSDNSAANQLIQLLGGVEAVTLFARSIGDTTFRLDRMETELNTAIPDDERDTTTPTAMGQSLQGLVLGDTLPAAQQAQLQTWMRGNTTGDTRIRAGVPKGWQVADKTGSGDYGTTNDIAVIWPPHRAPIVLAVYFTQPDEEAAWPSEVIASATRIAIASLS